MNTTIIRKSDNITSDWSGGTTSQVYIYPAESDYKKRDFLFRMSVANAYVKDSVYTELRGVTRYLVSLCGTAELIHNASRKVCLEPFGYVDCFDGGEHTEAHGAIRDFNLMLRKNTTGEMLVVDNSLQNLSRNWTHIAFYTDECCTIRSEKCEYFLSKGDCIVFTDITENVSAELICSNLRIIRCNVMC